MCSLVKRDCVHCVCDIDPRSCACIDSRRAVVLVVTSEHYMTDGQVILGDLVRLGSKRITFRRPGQCPNAQQGRFLLLSAGRESFVVLILRRENMRFQDIPDEDLSKEGFLASGSVNERRASRMILRRVLSYFKNEWVHDSETVDLLEFVVVQELR